MHFKNLFILTCLLISTEAFADDEEKAVVDLLNGKSVKYNTINIYKNVPALNTKDPLEIFYPVLMELKNKKSQRTLNKKLYEIFVKQVEDKGFLSKLKIHFSQNLSSYIKRGLKADTSQIFKDNQFYYTPMIRVVDCRNVSLMGNILALEAVFHYHTRHFGQNPQHRHDDFSYAQIYYFDLSNGKVYDGESVFLHSKMNELNLYITSEFKNVAHPFPIQFHMGDFDDVFYFAIDSTNTPRVKTLVDFNASTDGFLYTRAFSFGYYIPAWHRSSRHVAGQHIDLRLSIEELSQFLNPKGPYGFLIGFKLKDSAYITHSNNVNGNWFLKYSELEPHYESFPYVEFAPKTIGGGIKSVLIRHVDPKRKDSANQLSDFKVMHYRKNGFLVDEKYFVPYHVSTRTFTMDSNGNLLNFFIYQQDRLIQSAMYKYDPFNRPVSSIRVPDGNEVFYYGPGFSLAENRGPYAEEYQYTRYDYDKNGYVLRSTMITNEEGGLTRVFGYNEIGQLAYTHVVIPTYGETYMYSGDSTKYVYDSLGRMVFVSSGIFYRAELTYDSTNRLPACIQYEHRSIREEQPHLSTRSSYKKIMTYNQQGLPEKYVYLHPGLPPKEFYFYYEYW